MTKKTKYILSMSFAVATVIAAWIGCFYAIYHLVIAPCNAVETCLKVLAAT